jgi:hypothetical protein
MQTKPWNCTSLTRPAFKSKAAAPGVEVDKMRGKRSAEAPFVCSLLLLTKHSTSTQAVGARGEEFDQAHIAQNLELLTNFGLDVAIRGV